MATTNQNAHAMIFIQFPISPITSAPLHHSAPVTFGASQGIHGWIVMNCDHSMHAVYIHIASEYSKMCQTKPDVLAKLLYLFLKNWIFVFGNANLWALSTIPTVERRSCSSTDGFIMRTYTPPAIEVLSPLHWRVQWELKGKCLPWKKALRFNTKFVKYQADLSFPSVKDSKAYWWNQGPAWTISNGISTATTGCLSISAKQNQINSALAFPYATLPIFFRFRMKPMGFFSKKKSGRAQRPKKIKNNALEVKGHKKK